MTIAELIDALTALPNKERDVLVHIRGTISGILDIESINTSSGYDHRPDEFSIYLQTPQVKEAAK